VGSPALDALNLRYVVAPPSSSAVVTASGAFQPISGGDVDVFENQRARGDAWLAGRWSVSNASDIEDFASGKGISAAADGCSLNRDPGISPEEGPGEARATWHDGQFVALSNSPSPKILVTSTLWEPGWRAHLDGVSIHPLIADSLFIAAPVPAGSHRLILRYLPAPIQVGLYVSLLSLSVAAALIASSCFSGRWYNFLR
jgi:hypothetical protein